MAAIPATVAAAELFGHARGAFTGAMTARDGYFVAADRGSLFLDEIGQTPADVQSVLLRVMESGVIQPLGGQLREVSVRLLAATDSDLEAAVAQGKFSHALLRRFGYEIRLPPLRERAGDIPELFACFLLEELRALGELQRLEPEQCDRDPLLTAQVVLQLMAYPWPGNVRELRSAARRFAIHNRGRARVERDVWSQTVLKSTLPPPDAAPARREREPRELSEEQIAQALEACDFGIERAARELGVSRSWLHTRIDAIASLRKAKDLSLPEIRDALAQSEGDLVSAARALRVSVKGLQLQMTRLGMRRRSGK
jgi:two-component system nitrogen regulation response regulator GlnG